MILATIASFTLVAIARIAFKATWTQKAEYTNSVFKCAIFKTLVVAGIFLWCSSESKHSHAIVKHYREKHNIKNKWISEKFYKKENSRRKLASCEATTDQKTCDASDSCAWCTSAAVPSGCKSLSDAKFLPSAVFKCDKISAEDKLNHRYKVHNAEWHQTNEDEEYDFDSRKRGMGQCPFKIALAILMIGYFYCMKQFEYALEAYAKIGGFKKVAFTKCMEKKFAEETPVYNYSQVSRDSMV